MTSWRILCGDVREQLATLDAGSVRTCVTSPPYWGLRDYGVSGQLGLEQTPEAYVAAMVDVFRDVRRVLSDDGTLWLNLGDSYAGVGAQTGGTNSKEHGRRAERMFANSYKQLPQGVKSKDLVGIPWMVAFALRADGWYLRSDVIWSKPNPMPESVTDRPTKAHEYIFLLSKSKSYYYDANAIKEELAPSSAPRVQYGWRTKKLNVSGSLAKGKPVATAMETMGNRFAPVDGRNKRSVWHVATQPYPDAHFATYPEALIEPCILAGTSEKGKCPLCFKPWVRLMDSQRVMRHELPRDHKDYRPGRYSVKSSGSNDYAKGGGQAFRLSTTLGWVPSCYCMNDPANDAESLEPIPDTVLDPFTGSGTTGAVAIRHQRNFIGTELNPAYVELARKRIGAVAPLLTREVA